MRRLISFLLILTLLAPSFVWAKEETNQETVQELLVLQRKFQLECVPLDIKESRLERYFKDEGISLDCWKLLAEIQEKEKTLKTMPEIAGCAAGNCQDGQLKESQLNLSLNLSNKPPLSCSAEKKDLIKKSCDADMKCILSSGILPLSTIMPSLKPANCDRFNDNCGTQIVTAFFKGGVVFFESLFHLMKLGFDYSKDKIKEFWKDITKAEEHSSMAQLTLAEASEDPGFFEELKKDFPGTMSKLWDAFLASVKEWLKTDIFCEKWKGKPHFSQCLSPAPGFDCIGCKNLFTGMCSITGYISSEIIPAFFTGGIITAAKYGAKGAAKIARHYKIPEYTRKILIEGPLKVAKESSAVVMKTPGLRQTIITADKYLLDPSVKLSKAARETLITLFKTKPVQLMLKGGEETLSFSYRVTSASFKAVLYPINNPMTTLAFESGSKGVEKLFKLGSPKLVTGSAVLANLVEHQPELERLWTRLEELKLNSKADLAQKEQLIFEIHEKLKKTRSENLSRYLKNQTTSLNELIKFVYPELQYLTLASKLKTKEILQAEEELYQILSKAKDKKLLQDYNKYLSESSERYALLKKDQPFKEVLDNSIISETERKNRTILLLGKHHLAQEKQEAIYLAVKEAHEVAPLHGVYQYTWREIREKQRILIQAGLTKKEAELVIRHGLAGNPPVREIIDPPHLMLNISSENLMRKDFPAREKELFEALKKNQNRYNAKLSQQNLEALYFIDYKDTVVDLAPIFRNFRSLGESHLYEIYEDTAFINFKQAKQFLDVENPDVSVDLLKELHTITMKNGVENLEPSSLGKTRSTQWLGSATEDRPITLSAVNEIKSNKYLVWNQTGSFGNSKITGNFFYPNAQICKKETLYLLMKTHPNLVSDIEKYQELAVQMRYMKQKLARVDSIHLGAPDVVNLKKRLEKVKVEFYALDARKTELTSDLVEALTEYEINLFKKQRASIGKLDTIEKVDKYVDIVASLQKNLVSIHPLPNGNGRSTRLLMNHLLNREGLPSSRLISTEGDLYRSHEEWRKAIKEGMLASDQLVNDLSQRLELGLPVENSMDLFLPQKRKISPVPLKSSDEVRTQQGLEIIDPRLMREVVKRELKNDKNLMGAIIAEPEKSWRQLTEKTQETFKKNNIYYEHPKKGIERVELGFVDDDFRHVFGEPTYQNKNLYEYKMNNWYSDQLSWRGYSSKTKVYSDDEIISHFTEINPNLVSNRVRAKIEAGAKPTEVRMTIEEDFDQFNNDVFGTGLAQKAKDHALMGDQRVDSYGLSTSKKREVAKAFSMGAMDLEKYGEHMKPEVQGLLKSRILVGSKKAVKDIDLARLKQVREDFSYDYGRQQEVISVGAIEPDAVTIVQTIDDKGDVLKTYIRNPQDPKQVFIIPKDIDQSLPINPLDAEKIINLP